MEYFILKVGIRVCFVVAKEKGYYRAKASESTDTLKYTEMRKGKEEEGSQQRQCSPLLSIT